MYQDLLSNSLICGFWSMVFRHYIDLPLGFDETHSVIWYSTKINRVISIKYRDLSGLAVLFTNKNGLIWLKMELVFINRLFTEHVKFECIKYCLESGNKKKILHRV